MISLIIPCYNEKDNLKRLFDKLDYLIKEFSNEEIEIIIVDNGSTDKSNEIIKKNKLFLDKKISLLSIKENNGYGDGINQGINYSKGNIICWFHADLQFDPIDALKIYIQNKDILTNNKIIIKGKRLNRSILDIFFTFGMSIFTLLLFSRRLNDINAQPKIFNWHFLKFINNPPLDFSFDVYFLLIALKNNFKIIETPVKWYDRNAGVAKGGGSLKLKLKLTLRTVKYMMKLRFSQLWK